MSKINRIDLGPHGLTIYSPYSSAYIGLRTIIGVAALFSLGVVLSATSRPWLGASMLGVAVAYIPLKILLFRLRIRRRGGNPPPYGSGGASGVQGPLVPVAPLVGSDEKAFPQDRSA